jgi:hypothetical protein
VQRAGLFEKAQHLGARRASSQRWRGISGIATRHRTWYGENARAEGPGARIMGGLSEIAADS